MSSGIELAFTLDADGTRTPLTLPINQAVIAGWTGRDPVARDKHIAELEAIGIARPASTPIYYRVAARRLTTADSIEVSGAESSGEVEFVLFGVEGRILVGARLRPHRPQGRTYSVTVSKQMCDKPIAPVLWALDEVEHHWDRMILRAFAWIGGARVLYQEGTLDAMLPVRELMRAVSAERTAGRLRDVRRHLCRQGRHPSREPFRVRARRPGAEAQDWP